jgi:hypothetical protein
MTNFPREPGRAGFALVLMTALFCPLWVESPGVASPTPSPQAAPKAQDVKTISQAPESAEFEDWDTPSLGTSRFLHAKPLVAQRDVTPTFIREFIHLQWRPLDPIYLYLIRPIDGVPPVVLYLYGYPSDTVRFMDSAFCARVTRQGFAAAGFCSALTGSRYRMRPMREWFVSELREALAKSAHDVQLVLNYLSGRADLDPGRVGVFGQGSGGAIAILAAAVDRRIKAVDLLNPWGCWPEWMKHSSLVPEPERAKLLEPEFLKRARPWDPLQWFGRLRDRPVRLQQVADDPTDPLECMNHMERAAPPTARIRRFSDRRTFRNECSEGRLFEWMREALGSPALTR